MSEKELNKEESLELITRMINQAKSNYNKRGSFFFLLWGWAVMLANIGHYMLGKFSDYPHPYIVWLIAIPAGIISGIYGARLSRKALVVSHLDRLYGKIWLAVGLGIIICLLFMSKLSFNHNAVILLLSGIGTYISGVLLRFSPLIWGSIALGVASIVAFNVPMIDQYLVGGVGILLGYLVPGYLLKNKEE